MSATYTHILCIGAPWVKVVPQRLGLGGAVELPPVPRVSSVKAQRLSLSNSAATAKMTVAAMSNPPSLYAPTALPAARAAGIPRLAGRVRADGKCEACVCEICICGTHHCPPTPRHLAAHNEEKQQLTTHTQSTYRPHPASAHPLRAGPPPAAFRTGGAFYGSSRYADEFRPQPYSVQQPAATIQSPPMFDTDGALQTDTEANSRYVRHSISKPRLHRPVSPFVSAGEMLTTASSYAASYINHPSSAAQSCTPPSSLTLSDTDDRNWQTEHSAYYTRKPVERRTAVRPLQTAAFLVEVDAVQAGISESAAAYTRRHTAPVTACRPQHANHTDDDGFERSMATEKQTAYGNKAAQQLQQFKPAPALVLSNERFEGSTTTHSSYATLPASAYSSAASYQNKVAASSIGPVDEDRSFSTEKSERYTRHGLADRATPTNTPYTTHIDLAAMDGDSGPRTRASEAQSRFIDHGYCAAELCTPIAARALDSQPFVGQSTSHATYSYPTNQARRQSIRSASVLKVEDEDRQWVTEAKYHYQKKEVEPCPAAELEDRAWKDRHGHIWYEKQPEETRWKRKGVVRSQSGTALW